MTIVGDVFPEEHRGRATGSLMSGFALASVVVFLAKPVLRSVTGLLNYSLGLILGGISGAFVMMAAGAIGMSAALFGLLPPIVAAMLGGAVANGVMNKVFPERAAYETKKP